MYIAAEDEEWTVRPDTDGVRRLIQGQIEEIAEGVTAIKCGGHFPGSLVLHWENKLFIADTIKIIAVSFLGRTDVRFGNLRVLTLT